MAITATCPKCGKSGQAPEGAVGKKARCKNCQSVFLIEKPSVATSGNASKPVALVGDPSAGLEALAKLFRREGISVGEVNEATPGLPAMFCVSLCDGPVPAMREAVRACVTRSPVPLGLIGLHASMV